MSTASSKRVTPAHSIPNPHKYIEMMGTTYRDWVYDAPEACSFKSFWREKAFLATRNIPLDLEIGVGNGFFFAEQAKRHPDRLLLGLELKFKPLIQTIRRATSVGARNVRVARFHASLLSELFGAGELNNVYIYFPDPWPKKKTHKHRLIQESFLKDLHAVIQPGSFVEFKTDNLDYFDWTLKKLRSSSFRITRLSYDLHHSEWASENFVTHFEKLWTSKGLKTNLVRFERD